MLGPDPAGHPRTRAGALRPSGLARGTLVATRGSVAHGVALVVLRRRLRGGRAVHQAASLGPGEDSGLGPRLALALALGPGIAGGPRVDIGRCAPVCLGGMPSFHLRQLEDAGGPPVVEQRLLPGVQLRLQ
eukprot:5818105-Heterocapsa_arctica.AAC.1